MERQYRTTENQRMAVRRYQKNHPEKFAKKTCDYLAGMVENRERRYNAQAGRYEDMAISCLNLGTIEPDSY
jgi:putative salt-induced outer membrane protein YdiY